MSIINNVLIRSSSYLKERGLLEVMLHTDRPIPLTYQYSQQSSKGFVPASSANMKDSLKVIGQCYNIHEEKEMVMCTVELYDMNRLSANFMGIVDNYLVKTVKKKGNSDVDYELVRFVIYNKDFKRKVDQEVYERELRKASKSI